MATQVAEPIIIGDIGGDEDLAIPVASSQGEPSESVAALRAAGEIAALTASAASGPIAGEPASATLSTSDAPGSSGRATGESSALAEPAAVAAPIIPSAAGASGTGESAALASPATSDSAAMAPQSASAKRADSGPNPFDEQVWRAEGGSDSEADAVIARPPIARGALVGTVVAFLRERRNLAIAAGAAVLLIVIIGFAASGGSSRTSAKQSTSSDKSPVAKADTNEPAPAPEPPANEESTASTTATATGSDATDETATGSADETATGSADETTTEPAAEPASAEPASRPTRHAAPTIRGKRIVLEYDSQAREAKPIVNAPKNDQAAIGRARTSYAAGNTRLFAGDADGAIRNYRQALAYYPGYIAGYRGLGLAYAQKGDKTNAIRALRTYLSAVPRAKDAPLIRKRIQMLSR
jgi:hypothetical protein